MCTIVLHLELKVEEAFLVEETYYNRYLTRITEGMDRASTIHTGYKTPTAVDSGSNVPKDTSSGNREITEKQRKAMFVISHKKIDGKWVHNNNFQYLTKDIEDYSFDQASDFIERYGKKS